MFQTEVVEKIETFYDQYLFPHTHAVGNVEKFCRAGHATDDMEYGACAFHNG
jgi:hypothetical protein